MNSKCEITDQFIAVQNHQIFVRRWLPPIDHSPSATVPIFLIHDSLGCVETWGKFPELLCQTLQRTVVAYDRLGYGKSDPLIDLPPLNFIEKEALIFLPQLLNALNIHSLVAFGHSVGGAMALAAAANNKQIKAVISESTQAFVEQKTLEGIRNGRKFFETKKGQDWLKKYHGEKSPWVLKAWADTWLNKDFNSWSLLGSLNSMNVPCLIIHGDKDEYGSSAFPNAIAQGVKGSQEMHIFKDCGHIPHKEFPDATLQKLSHFFEVHNFE